MPSLTLQKAASYEKFSSKSYSKWAFFAVLILLISFAQTQTPPTFTSTPTGEKVMIRTDTKDAVLSLRSSTDPALSYSISYSSPMSPIVTPPATNPKLVAVTSLSSFDCLASTQLSFNMSISSPSVTGFTMEFQILGNTYLNKLRFNYLAAAWDPGYTDIVAVPPVGPADILYNDCFLTSDLAIVTATRSQTFTKQTIAIALTDNSKTKIQSFITGLKFFNNKDVSKKVSVSSTIENGTNFITQTVTVTGNTVLQWICLGTVVIDTTFPDFYQQILPYDIGNFVLDRLSATIDTTTFPTNYLTKFGNVDNKFFGLIELELYLGKPYQIIKFLSDNVLTVHLGYESLAAGGKMGYFFLSKRECTPNTLLYSLVDSKCYSLPCPPGTAQDGTLLICAPCHYSCKTCTGLTDLMCDSCDPNMKRDPVSGGQCKCSPGFTDNGVALCEPCVNFMPFCQNCLNTKNCTSCTQSYFAVKADFFGCQCDQAAFPFYVTASDVCAPFPGCLTATKTTTFVSCTKCDSALNFNPTPAATCVCQTNFTMSGNKCIDICGDGFNPYPNTTYCDDGNPTDGDGCTVTCTVETAKWGCFNPPTGGPSICRPLKTFTMKYLYAQRVVSENAGNFYFELTPVDPQLSQAGFTYYVETTIPHISAIGVYDPETSILKIKIIYKESVEDTNHDIHITLDPYVMSVAKASFSIKASGVNYDLIMEKDPKMNLYLWYVTAGISGIVVITALVLTFINYKIAAVELLLSSQLIYMALHCWVDDNLSFYPLSALKYLTGYNTLKIFEINRYNSNTPFLLSSYTFAEFLLNFNIMPAIVVLVIFILIPLKINVWFRTFQRNRFTSAEMQQKLMTQEPGNNSLSEMSSKIKTAQNIADTYVDRVYFGFSLVAFLPIVLYFSIQLGFIGKVGRYELSSFANIMLSILLLMLDFCFFILVFQDTDKKLKTFNFGSKKLKSYPNRLMMFYFATCCIFTIVLLTDFTFYVLSGMTLITGIYVFVQNPYDKCSLEYFDAVSKPIIALGCQIAIKILTFLPNQAIFIPIVIDALLLISTIVTIVRVYKVKTNRSQATKKMLEDVENDDDENADYEKNVKTTDESDYNSTKQQKKMNVKLTKGSSQDQSARKSSSNDNDRDNDQDDSAGQLNKDDSPNHHNDDELGEEEEDELTRIKRSLRQDLKKRRGIVQKVGNDEVPAPKTKKPKGKKSKGVDFAQDKKNE